MRFNRSRGSFSPRGHRNGGKRDFRNGPRNDYRGGPRKDFRNGPRQDYKKKEYKPKVNLREDQVGITEYINDGPGFTGVFKSRFSDFHVNEIDLNGKVLYLDDLEIPKPNPKTLSEEEMKATRKELEGVVPEDLWTKLDTLSKEKNKNHKYDPVEFDASNVDKEARTKIHQIIKQLYGKSLVSTTVNKEDETKMIRVLKRKGSQMEHERKDWDFDGPYVHFLVYKENKDTVEVASTLASRMRISASQFTYCGTKDKRGKTTQQFCIKKRTPYSLVGAVRGLDGVHIGNFEFKDKPLRLGDLKGNRFRIALRHINANREDIVDRLERLKENGFINYYGLQRFGNCASIPTHEVGVAILKSEFQLACELILKPRDNDIEFMRPIREMWWKNRDSKKAAEMFRSNNFIEKQLLNGLAHCGENDYCNALRSLPRNMLLLYLHSFQSIIFNRMASRRIKEYGLKLIPGDLVFKDEETDDDIAEEVSSEEDLSSAEEEDNDEENEDEEEPETKKAKLESEEENSASKVEETNGSSDTKENSKTTEEVSSFKDKVKALTQDDIDSGKYSIFDIVLPLPGFDITYPDNDVGQWYEESLQEHGLSSEKMRHKIKTFAMAGAYRKMLIKPYDMSWEFKTYKTNQETLIFSDWENLRPNAKPKPVNVPKDAPDYTALLMEFNLPSSAYATMLLRELLKEDTSSSNQANLEKKYNDESLEKTSKEEDDETEKEETENGGTANESEKTEKLDDSEKAEETEEAEEADSKETTEETENKEEDTPKNSSG